MTHANGPEQPTAPAPTPAVPGEVALGELAFDEPWKAPFLHAYSRTLNISQACRMAGVGRTTVYDARRNDARFAEALKTAKAVAIDLLASIAHQRATVGHEVTRTTTRVKTDQGGNVVEQETSTVTYNEVDNGMVRWLLARHDPEHYGDRVDHVHGGDPDRPVQVEVYRIPARDQAAALLQIAAELGMQLPAGVDPVIEGNGRPAEDEAA